MLEMVAIFALGFVGGCMFMYALVPEAFSFVEDDPTEHGRTPL